MRHSDNWVSVKHVQERKGRKSAVNLGSKCKYNEKKGVNLCYRVTKL